MHLDLDILITIYIYTHGYYDKYSQTNVISLLRYKYINIIINIWEYWDASRFINIEIFVRSVSHYA